MRGIFTMELRKKLSLNKDWSFHLGDLLEKSFVSHGEIYGAAKAGAVSGPPSSSFNASKWLVLDIPHDYMIGQETTKNGAADWGYKPRENAWYRKAFAVDEKYRGKRFIIEFEGVATEATVYFNGSVAKRSFSGYTGFSIDVTDMIKFGGAPNILAVHVNGKAFEGWWYEGTGIYRPVWLNILPEMHFAEEPYIKCEKLEDKKWEISVSGAISVKNPSDVRFSVRKIVKDMDGKVVLEFDGISAVIDDPHLWDIDDPYLYTLTSEFYADGRLEDSITSVFGFRTIKADPDKGFFLNGRPLKLRGTCNHQDFAGIGTAIPDSIWTYKIMRLKSMGCNAYRSAHGMVPNALVNACDRLGMILMDENRNFGSSEECLDQLKAMVKRDRNHPSVMFYSIFNEEPMGSTEQGKNISLHMLDEIRRLDSTRPVTGAMNGGVLEKNGAGGVLDLVGINYQSYAYDDIHRKYPDIPMIASETTSSFQTRGCTETSFEKHTFSCYDEDVSDWGNSIRDTWQAVDPREFIMGAFMWTGFDYLGEPTPHVYPSVSSFFGLMDTCGFEKGGYYLTKAIWSDTPYAAILPDNWNFIAGESVKVMSCTNCEEAELFLNGVSCGRVKIDKYKQHIWNVVFESGEIKLVGYNNGIPAASCVKETALQPEKLVLAPCFDHFDENIAAIPVIAYMADEKGNIVPDRNDEVRFSISGGEILGTGNGDPNCHTSFKSKKRSLFAGKAMAVVSAKENAENVLVKAKVGDMKQVRVTIPVRSRSAAEFVPSVKEIYIPTWRMSPFYDNAPDPNVIIADSDMNSWQPFTPEGSAHAETAGKAGKFVMFRVGAVIPEMINGKAPSLHFNNLWGSCRIYVGGTLVGSCDNGWGTTFDVPVPVGEHEITVLVRITDKNGGGICAPVVIM